MVRVRAFVYGRVQGVWYRGFTERRATGLGLAGWIRNLADGGVEVLAEGPRPRIEELLALLRQGPPGARVDALDAEWGTATGEYEGFRIRPTAY
jgi:acylphosphatase